MSKYIIDIPDGVPFVLLKKAARREEYGEFITKVVPFAELEELNPDYINKHYGELQDEAYQAGLNDAWEAARRICLGREDGGISNNELMEIFKVGSDCTALKKYSAQEAIIKLKAYEQKQIKRDIGNDIDYIMQSTGMTVEEIAQGLKEMRN